MLVAAVQSPPTVGRCFTVSGAHPPPGSSDLAAVLVAAVQSPPAVGRCFTVSGAHPPPPQTWPGCWWQPCRAARCGEMLHGEGGPSPG